MKSLINNPTICSIISAIISTIAITAIAVIISNSTAIAVNKEKINNVDNYMSLIWDKLNDIDTKINDHLEKECNK